MPPINDSQSRLAGSEFSDEVLIRRYCRGETAAFEALLSRYRRQLFTYLLRSVGDRSDAEELYQDVWMRVIGRAEAFREESKFATWLYAIARNRCVDHQRRMRLRTHSSLDSPKPGDAEQVAPLVERLPSLGPTVESEAIGREAQKRIVESVEALPAPQREVFLLRELQGLTFDQIAEIVEASPNTVKSRMRYALERLREAMGDLEPGSRRSESQPHEL